MAVGRPPPPLPRIVGRHAVHDVVARGGMASIHLGRLHGSVRFSRTVAIKRLHEHFAHDHEFVSMLLDEARVTARIHHPNVVSVLDVVAFEGEVLLVMDYVQGESLSTLLRLVREREERVPLRIASAILVAALAGLHAAHEARDERGLPLRIVHRDVSPQNILVGGDGVVRVVDFGIAKASGGAHQSRGGQIMGKLRYMAPEQMQGCEVDRRVDVYAASAVLWHVLVGRRPHGDEESDAAILYKVIEGKIEPPSRLVSGVPAEVDDIVTKGLSGNPNGRFSTAQELADALERAIPPATVRDVAIWVRRLAGPLLREREDRTAAMERALELLPVVVMPSSRPPARSLLEETLAEPGPRPRPAELRRRRALFTVVTAVGAIGVAGALASLVHQPGRATHAAEVPVSRAYASVPPGGRDMGARSGSRSPQAAPRGSASGRARPAPLPGVGPRSTHR